MKPSKLEQAKRALLSLRLLDSAIKSMGAEFSALDSVNPKTYERLRDCVVELRAELTREVSRHSDLLPEVSADVAAEAERLLQKFRARAAAHG